MTDRQVGSDGLRVDLTAGERRVAGEGLTVEAAPQLETRSGASWLSIDYTYPQGVQVGQFGLSADAKAAVSLALGSIGLMVDYVTSLVPTNAARWSGAAFEMGTTSPLTYWSAGAFRSSGSKPVVWVTDHFEEAP